MPLMTPEDHAFFRENGYLVVSNAVPLENCAAVVDTLWEYLGMDRNDPEDWYRPPLRPGGMVEIYQHQALWNNRQYPRVHQIFSELLGTERLWVSIDRANFKPPQHPDHPEYDHTGFIHWDTDSTKPPASRRVQGVLYLTDTTENQGGFQCVPELYRNFDTWQQTQPPDRNPRVPDLTGFSVTPVPGKAGDLLIWDVMLAHGNGHNVSDRPRFAQYFSMFPAREDNEELRAHRVRCWQNRLPPGPPTFPGDPREIEQKNGATAELTPLGRKLLGLDRWEQRAAGEQHNSP
jgi:ectoine hydroxylase-related dioxygenase (phytanoyl-CoA dioxygenase family)